MLPFGARRNEHALAFSEAAISLLRREAGGDWIRLDRAAIDSGHLRSVMTAMRALLPPGRAEVQIFLPPEHVLSARLPKAQGDDIAEMLAARAGCDADALSIARWHPPGSADVMAFAADRTTIAEAVAYAQDWGFVPTAVTVHPSTVPAGCTLRFPSTLPSRVMALATPMAAAAAVVLILGMSANLFWLGSPSAPVSPSTAQAPQAQVTLVATMPPSLHDAAPKATVVAPAVMAPVRPLATSQEGAHRPPSDGTRAAPAAPALPREAVRIGAATMPLPPEPPDQGTVPGTAATVPASPPVRLAALTDPAAAVLRDTRPTALSNAPPRPPASSPDGTSVEPSLPSLADAPAEPVQPTPNAPADALQQAASTPIETGPEEQAEPVATISGPASPLPVFRPEGLVTPERAALANAPRAPRPVARPASVARRAVASRTISVPSGPASGRIAAAATIPDALPLGDTGLLGIVTTGNRRQAILRLESGDITTVSQGDRVGQWRVGAVDDNSIRLIGSDGRRTLRLVGR